MNWKKPFWNMLRISSAVQASLRRLCQNKLRGGLGSDGVVALTQVIGIANLFSRFNNALHTYSSEDYA
jgi:hypothetical protein